jgi:FSR family fosmidomycin resistance protein-like MFS transporter
MEATHEASTAATLAQANPPEANRRLALVSLAHGVTHMRGAILPLIYPTLMRAMGFGYVELGVLLSITRLLSGLLQSIWGTVARYVPGKYLIGGDNAGVGVGMILVGMSHTYPELVGAVSVGQVAASPQHPIGSAMITRWFGRKLHGTSLSIHWAGANVVTIITPLIATALLVRFGWQTTLYVFSVPAILIGGAIMLTLPREMVSPRVKARRRGFSLRQGFLAPLGQPRMRRLILAASVTAGGKGIGVLQTYVPLLLSQELHLNAWATGILFALFMTTSVVGPLIAGRMSDRRDRPRFLSWLFVGSCIGAVMVALLAHASVWAIMPMLLLFGLAVYRCSPVEQAVVADLTSTELRASAYSLFFAVTFAVGALWPIALGTTVEYLGFTGLFLLLALSYLAAALLYGRGDWSVADASPAQP